MFRLIFIRFFFLFVQLPAVGQYLSSQEVAATLQRLQASEADTTHVELLLKLAQHHVYKPGENIADLDSGLVLIKQAKQLSEQILYPKGVGKSYLGYSEAYREKGEREKGMDYIDRAIGLFTKNSLYEELGDAYMERRHYFSVYVSKNEVISRAEMTQKAIAAYKKTDNKLKIGYALKESGDLHAFVDEFPAAIQDLKEALSLYRSVNFTAFQGIYDLLGKIYFLQGNTDEAIRYGYLAIEYGIRNNDSTQQMSTIYCRLGMTHNELSQFNKAYEFYHKALEIAQKNNDIPSIITIYNNIISLLLRQYNAEEALAIQQEIEKKYPDIESNLQFQRLYYLKNYVKIYQQLQQYDKGQLYCNEMLRMAEKIDSASKKLMYAAVIDFYITSRQYERAVKYLPVLQVSLENNNQPQDLSFVYRAWSRIDSARGDYLSALTHYQKYKALQDTVFNATKSKQIAQMQTQFETDKKDKELKLKEQNIELLTQQSQLDQAKIQKVTFIRNFTFSGIAFLLVIVGLLFNRYRLKQRNNKQLQAQQLQIHQANLSLNIALEEQHKLLDEKELLLREIHHRVKNNLQIVMSLLNTQSKYLDNDAAVFAIRKSQHRMQAMSLIHEKLYTSNDVASLDMLAYMKDLINYFRKSYNMDYYISFEIDIDPIKLDVGQAVPLGLILNEAITNAIKYAFPEKQKGFISIRMKYQSDRYLQLHIHDNGVGLPVDFEPQNSNSLGMNLMHGLTEQLGGTFTIENDHGLTITITFKDEKMMGAHLLPSAYIFPKI